MLGPRIAALRRSAGFSQAELAQKLQMSPSAVGMYEQGRREPSAQILVEMAKLFGVSTDYLLTGRAGNEQEEAVVHQALLDVLHSADQRLQKRDKRPFTKEELTVLMAAMLLEA
jgi:transcriptional regulator with XRE-family HTH domain